jgi:hypothetical protein
MASRNCRAFDTGRPPRHYSTKERKFPGARLTNLKHFTALHAMSSVDKAAADRDNVLDLGRVRLNGKLRGVARTKARTHCARDLEDAWLRGHEGLTRSVPPVWAERAPRGKGIGCIGPLLGGWIDGETLPRPIPV